MDVPTESVNPGVPLLLVILLKIYLKLLSMRYIKMPPLKRTNRVPANSIYLRRQKPARRRQNLKRRAVCRS